MIKLLNQNYNKGNIYNSFAFLRFNTLKSIKYKEALDVYKKAIELDPQNFYAYFSNGYDNYYSLGNLLFILSNY